MGTWDLPSLALLVSFREEVMHTATEMMVKFVRKTLVSTDKASSWWECFSSNDDCETLDQLIIILDEVGKVPELALGLVDEVRHILIKIQNNGLAKSAMLVLVGSGLDGYIYDSSPDFRIVTTSDLQEYLALQSIRNRPF
jgi:hypothetical protein